MSVGAPGLILSAKYRLERELGRGGMGTVWLAEHLTLRSPVAVKLIEPELSDDTEALNRFLREAQAAAALRSPHVVQILDHGVDHGAPFIVMELLEGESLAARLARVQRLSPAELGRLMTDVGRAMTKAHEAGIVHRDLKPDNVFIVRNDEQEIAKVLDFGVAKASLHGFGSVSSATRTGAVLGTPYYMSPEQVEGSKSVDHRSDIWAMGVIAWECLLGSRPFQADTLGGLLLAICARPMPVPSQQGAVPPGFDAWFARACAREPSSRFQTAKEAAQALLGLADALPLAATSPAFQLTGSAVPAASIRVASRREALHDESSKGVRKQSRASWLGVAALAVAGAAAVLGLRGSSTRSNAAASAPPTDKSAPSAAATAPAEQPAVLEPRKPENSVAPAPILAPLPGSAQRVGASPPVPAQSAARASLRPRPPAGDWSRAAASPDATAPAPAPGAAPSSKPRVNLGI